jgi:hypothetical protein
MPLPQQGQVVAPLYSVPLHPQAVVLAATSTTAPVFPGVLVVGVAGQILEVQQELAVLVTHQAHPRHKEMLGVMGLL